MNRLGALILGLLSLALIAAKSVFMLIGWALLWLDWAFEQAEQWLSVRAAILAGDAIPVFEEDYEDTEPCQCLACAIEREEATLDPTFQKHKD